MEHRYLKLSTLRNPHFQRSVYTLCMQNFSNRELSLSTQDRNLWCSDTFFIVHFDLAAETFYNTARKLITEKIYAAATIDHAPCATSSFLIAECMIADNSVGVGLSRTHMAA
jgi:hypothetical protein